MFYSQLVYFMNFVPFIQCHFINTVLFSVVHKNNAMQHVIHEPGSVTINKQNNIRHYHCTAFVDTFTKRDGTASSLFVCALSKH